MTETVLAVTPLLVGALGYWLGGRAERQRWRPSEPTNHRVSSSTQAPTRGLE